MATYTREQFIQMIAPSAIAEQKRTGVPASLTIAQAILESSDGNGNVAASTLTEKANALFGIKGTGNAGSIRLRTKEQTPSGKEYYTYSNFAAYKTWADSIQAHGDFLSSDKYAKARNVDGLTAATEVAKAGYATDVGYAAKLQNVMKTYGLLQYDDPSIKVNPVQTTPGVIQTGSGGNIIQAGLDSLNPFAGVDWMRVLWVIVGLILVTLGIIIAFNPFANATGTVAKVAKVAKKVGEGVEKATA